MVCSSGLKKKETKMKNVIVTIATLAALTTQVSALEFAVGDSGVNPDGSTFVVTAGAPVLEIDKRGGQDK